MLTNLLPIRVAPGGRYFETTDGKPFLFIGANDAITWPGLAGLYRRRDMAGVDAYLADLAAKGVTILRLMLEYAHTDGWYFERPAGRFNPTMVRLWDDLLALCERHGLRVLLTPWDTFWMARRWHCHPYNQVNGGPAASPAAFFTDERVIDFTVRRLRFCIDRWGASGVIAAWDLFNEVHPHWGGTVAEQHRVIARISAAVRKAELGRWGWMRPQTVSIFGAEPGAEYEDLVFRHPALDFTTTHIYHKRTIDHPRDTVAPAIAMARCVRYALARTLPARPFTDSEHGPIYLFNNRRRQLPEDFDDEYERHLMWAHLASGGAGSGMRWPARHPHMLTSGMKGALQSLASFIDLFEWQHFAHRDRVAEISVAGASGSRSKKSGMHVFGCGDERQMIVWLLRDRPRRHPADPARVCEPLRDVPLMLRNLAPGGYCVHEWSTREGCLIGSLRAEVKEAGVLQVVLPVVENDLALAVHSCK